MLDLLAFSPHPDDVELACGGLIAKMSKKEYDIGIIDLTRGEMGSAGTAEIRLQEANKAAHILGVTVRENMDFGDCRLSTGFEHGKRLADKIRKFKPSILLIPYGDDRHPDHISARKLSEKAVFLAKLSKLKTQEKPYKMKTIVYYMLYKPFKPTFIVDITSIYNKKLEAIKAYQSQQKILSDFEGLLRYTEIKDQMYGSRINTIYGEPFYIKNPIKMDDPVAFWK
jgi:bacillithiol biosynthesis deacetylase BshB1